MKTKPRTETKRSTRNKATWKGTECLRPRSGKAEGPALVKQYERMLRDAGFGPYLDSAAYNGKKQKHTVTVEWDDDTFSLHIPIRLLPMLQTLVQKAQEALK